MIKVSAFRWVPPFARGLVRDLRVRWALEEAGLPYQARLIGPDDQKSESYRAMQPFGQVPAFEENNLVLFGDPSSNAVIAKIVEKLPVKWGKELVALGGKTFAADRHAPVMIYPNPLNPNRYVVINSGFTFREFDYLNNARQTPKLPDYAVIDVGVPVTAKAPGGIVEAGFFDEGWGVAK